MKFLLLAALFSTLGFGQSNDCDTLDKCQEAIKTDWRASLPHFRLGGIYFRQGNYTQAANEFRQSLTGDLQPKWIEALAHVELGKIFDVTKQRDRALNEYRLALRTKDNTHGALDEANQYTQTPYQVE